MNADRLTVGHTHKIPAGFPHAGKFGRIVATEGDSVVLFFTVMHRVHRGQKDHKVTVPCSALDGTPRSPRHAHALAAQ
jgi:hypothetical protein